jgi:hypothetical protein
MSEVAIPLDQLIEELSRPDAYLESVETVELRQTHISVVFLAGTHVYKVKKPVQLPFLDFSTLQQRKLFCDQEVRLNRRLAPDVYLGVVPIYSTPAGLRVGDIPTEGKPGNDPIVEWAVWMTRLPEENTFASRMEREELTDTQVEKLALRIADFHQASRDQDRSTPDPSKAARILECGSFDRIATAVLDNLVFARQQIGQTIAATVYERLLGATEQALERLKGLIERRVAGGMIRDLHGDLHLDHVYLFEDQSPPADLVIVDCIEFNDAFRFIDVVADIAFCTMDLLRHGHRGLARTLTRKYFDATGDQEGTRLLPFYTAYRAAVRGKVDSITSLEAEVPRPQREAAAARATAYWLLALGELESAEQCPMLVLATGLPGTGKSTLASGLTQQMNFRWIRSDAVRKDLASQAGLEVTAEPSEYQAGIYTTEWTDRTYAECLRQAMSALRLGERVVVDATFVEEHRRQEFLAGAVQLGVPAVWLLCDAAPDLVRDRLAKRRDDVSDADWSIYTKAAAAWQPPSVSSQRSLVTIDANQNPELMLAQAITAVSNFGSVLALGR